MTVEGYDLFDCLMFLSLVVPKFGFVTPVSLLMSIEIY